MNNFLEFINEDTSAKKTLISTMPVNTKTNIRKHNEKIHDIEEKYLIYRNCVKKYLDTKSKSFKIKEDKIDTTNLEEKVKDLRDLLAILNPTNTYVEKLGFDKIIYKINNYYNFNFKSLNDIINEFLDKFDEIGIHLDDKDFDYTYYVHEYMASFLEVRFKKSSDYSKVSEIFERIYWSNPELIEHIELNFRKLLKSNAKKIDDYIENLQKKVMSNHQIKSYDDCKAKYHDAYLELKEAKKENIYDIVALAKKGEIDITNYFSDNKIRIANFDSLLIDPIGNDNKDALDKFYRNIEKMQLNVEEYANYVKFEPLILDFKKQYEKELNKEDKNHKNTKISVLKSLEKQIDDKEEKLDKLNKKIFSGKLGIFEVANSGSLRQLKIESIKQATEIKELYKEFEKEYFKDKVAQILSSTITVSELLHLYYSFDYFKHLALKRIFNINNYDELLNYSNDFNSFAINPSNIILDSTLLFDEITINKIIINRYRLDNINLSEDTVNPGSLDVLIDKIRFLLRVNKIETSSLTMEKIWFIAQVEKIDIKSKTKTL